MRAALVVAVLGVAACETPSPALHLRFSEGPTQACPSLDCSQIPTLCPSVASIRILDPAAPDAPYHSQCTRLSERGHACALGGVPLELTRPLPVQELEVQVAVFPEHVLARDERNLPICPTDVHYGFADGFPVQGAIMPAMGGRSYYRPGDEEIVVVLGCTDLDRVNPPSCEGAVPRSVVATVDDFDRARSVFLHEAQRLSLWVGTPVGDGGSAYDLNLSGASSLGPPNPNSNPPAWSGEISTELGDLGCVAVYEDDSANTTTVTCRSIDLTSDWLDFTGRHAGVRLSRASLAQILGTLSLSEFPSQGITIGVVLDGDGDPVAGQVVSATEGTVRYLSSDRRLVIGGATAGGPQGGVFVSLDAPFNTTFSTTARGVPAETVSAIGGRIRGKVTIVVLRFSGNVVEPGD